MLALLILSGVLGQRPKTPLTGSNPSYFPIAVWLQSPANAKRYRAIGINLYVGLWEGPTKEQIDALSEADMPVVCELNEWAKKNLDSKIIAGWMHTDEPDNAQPLPDGKGYGPPVLPERIVADYQTIKKVDPNRPVVLNLGQGVAWDDWYGRGVRTHHPEDYAQYVKGADIASFDIYPVTSPPPVQGKLSYVGEGTKRLRDWTPSDQRVWACIEATHISNPDVKPTATQVKALVWMAIINGARGLIYFSHQFKPSFIEAGILADSDMAAAIKDINQQVQELAPAINSPEANLASPSHASAVDVSTHRKGKDAYLFTVSTSNATQTIEFKASHASTADVLGEDRQLAIKDGRFTDTFDPYAVHLYRLR